MNGGSSPKGLCLDKRTLEEELHSEREAPPCPLPQKGELELLFLAGIPCPIIISWAICKLYYENEL